MSELDTMSHVFRCDADGAKNAELMREIVDNGWRPVGFMSTPSIGIVTIDFQRPARRRKHVVIDVDFRKREDAA